MKLPAHGLDASALFERLDALQEQDLSWRTGRTYAYVYDAGKEVEDVGRRAFGDYMFQNALDPTAFPSLLKLENDLVGIALEHLGGGETSAGTFTSGGTESIMLAVKAARDFARATRPQVTEPEMILPTTGHAAFHKAAAYLGLKVVLTDVDSETFAADAEAVRAAITPNTILIVGSAPSYAHGVIDPIAAMGAIALEHQIPFHVDACVGGWLLPYFKRLGAPVPAFDLSVPGVTSLSVDLHKYGFAPKGASLVLYRDAQLRRFQYFTCTEWTGYSVINPTVQSSRSGGPLAAAWAVLHRLGDEGFLELARQVLEGTRQLIAGVEATPGLRVLGRPDFCMVAVTSEELGVYHLVDAMAAKGWYVQPQPPFRNSPASVHLSLSPKNAGLVAPLLDDLRLAVDEVRQIPFGQLAQAIQAQLADLDPADVAARFPELLGMAGIQGDALPEKMAGVNEMLGALPRPLAKELLTEFVGSLFSPTRELAEVGA
jgi:glutamate/tyrosine decarboxylase-like PLP-dependent enzyme